MDKFIAALIAGAIGVVSIDTDNDYACEQTHRALGVVETLHDFMRKVEMTLYQAGFEWTWVPSERALKLVIFGEVEKIAPVAETFLDGWGGDVTDYEDWHTRYGVVSVRKPIVVEYDGLSEEYYERNYASSYGLGL